MDSVGVPKEVIESIRDSIDCNLYFFGNKVPMYVSYLILALSTVTVILAVVLINIITETIRKKENEKNE